MTVMLEGREGIRAYQRAVIKQAIKIYLSTGIQPNRAYTPKAMIEAAERLTEKKFEGGTRRVRLERAMEAL